jgi:hypothetical protein
MLLLTGERVNMRCGISPSSEALMTLSTSLGTAVARLFLFPGDLACSLIGLDSEDKRELVRMLVNSLIWIIIGMLVVVMVT